MTHNRKTIMYLSIFAVLAIVLSGCAKKQVTRIDPGETVDLSGNWNDTDSRLVAEEMITDCLGRPWLATFLREARARQEPHHHRRLHPQQIDGAYPGGHLPARHGT